MSWEKRVEKLMQIKGWTQKDLSKESGITEASVSRYLKGERNPRIDVIVNFSKALGVSVEYLLNGEESKTNSFDEIAIAIARNGGDLSTDEQNRLIQLILSSSGDKNV